MTHVVRKSLRGCGTTTGTAGTRPSIRISSNRWTGRSEPSSSRSCGMSRAGRSPSGTTARTGRRRTGRRWTGRGRAESGWAELGMGSMGTDATARDGSFGVLAMGHVLGEPVEVAQAAGEYTDDVTKIETWGYRTFHRAEAGTGLTDLAESAGQLALKRSGVDAADVDLLVLAMSDIAEHLYWDPAAATQARLGAHQAEALLLNQACVSGVLSFDAVAGKFATHPEYRTALVIAANRVCEQYWNRMESTTSISSDGAAAAVLVRDHPRCRWLATATISDGRYANFFRLSLGGAAHPFRPGEHRPALVDNPFDRLEDFFGRDHRAMLRFVETIGERNREVLARACAQACVAPESVTRVIHQNDNLRAFAELAEELAIPLERTNVALAMQLGHLGCADHLLCLESHLAAGDLAAGDIVALTSVGSGMHWACTLLRI